jgi:hypothetical protein
MKQAVLIGLLMVASFVVGAVPAPPACAATDQRELKARESFAAGRYQDALDIFARLYAEKLHPNYLRNIGRCYQNLGDPEKAISSFREYLRKAKTLDAAERAEVQGYISEMEDLKRQREASNAPPAPRPAATPAAPVSAPTASSSPRSVSIASSAVPGRADDREPPPPGVMLTQAPGNVPPAAEPHPVYSRWWFWTLIGGAIVGGVAIVAVTGGFTKTQDAPCVGKACGQ